MLFYTGRIKSIHEVGAQCSPEQSTRRESRQEARLAEIAFDNTYSRLPNAFFARVTPAPVPSPALIKINESLARKVQARNEYDKTIQETEAAYMKILESSQTLLHVLKRESVNLTKKKQTSS